jgi:hypothetical protein
MLIYLVRASLEKLLVPSQPRSSVARMQNQRSNLSGIQTKIFVNKMSWGYQTVLGSAQKSGSGVRSNSYIIKVNTFKNIVVR